jgi:hypothetical protein
VYKAIGLPLHIGTVTSDDRWVDMVSEHEQIETVLTDNVVALKIIKRLKRHIKGSILYQELLKVCEEIKHEENKESESSEESVE